MKKQEAYDILCKEYIDKCRLLGGCDNCVAEYWCIQNDLRVDDIPNDYCYKKLKKYFQERK